MAVGSYSFKNLVDSLAAVCTGSYHSQPTSLLLPYYSVLRDDLFHCSYFLYSISHPGKSGAPQIDLSDDEEATVNVDLAGDQQLAIERVICKVFTKYSIACDVTDQIRSVFKTKLWRMGRKLSQLGGTKRLKIIDAWKSTFWVLTIDEHKLASRKHSLEKSLQDEVCKRQKLEIEIEGLRKTSKEQRSIITTLQKENRKGRGASSKSWNDFSVQHQRVKRKKFVSSVTTALSVVSDQHFVPVSVEVTQTDSGRREVVDLNKGTFTNSRVNSQAVPDDLTKFALYVKDKFSLSDTAYRELSQLTSSLPRLHSLKQLSKTLNSEFHLSPAPNGVVGIQQSLKSRLFLCLKNYGGLSEGDVVQVKLTGDGTNIGRSFHVVNVAFVLLNDLSSVSSPNGNHSLGIFKVSEDYDSLHTSLSDILKEACDLQSIEVNGRNHDVQFFLGGDMKFLAVVCGIEAANSTYSCIWCKCPAIDRWDMTKPAFDATQGARTIAEIESLCRKPKAQQMGCSKEPLFNFIPIYQVVIDSLVPRLPWKKN